MSAREEVRLGWTIARFATMSFWLALAAVLLWLRKQPVNWRSLSHAFVATGLTYLVLSSYLVLEGADSWVVAGGVVFYWLVSGLLCATVARPAIAAIAAPFLFALQLLGDVVVHVFSGVARFQ